MRFRNLLNTNLLFQKPDRERPPLLHPGGGGRLRSQVRLRAREAGLAQERRQQRAERVRGRHGAGHQGQEAVGEMGCCRKKTQDVKQVFAKKVTALHYLKE